MICSTCNGPAKPFGQGVGLCEGNCGPFDIGKPTKAKKVGKQPKAIQEGEVSAVGILRSQLSEDAVDVTLGEAVDYLESELFEGAKCPCCKRYAQIYPRNMYETNSLFLLTLLALCEVEDRYYHITEVAAASDVISVRMTGGDTSKAVYWGLLELKPKEKGDGAGKTSGYWRPTEKGKQFALGLITIPKYAIAWDGEVIGYQGEQVSIQDTLGEKFNYDELISKLRRPKT